MPRPRFVSLGLAALAAFSFAIASPAVAQAPATPKPAFVPFIVTSLTPAQEARLAKGEVLVGLVAKHPIYHLDVYGIVDGTPDQVWSVITDYGGYGDFLPLVTESGVQKRQGSVVFQHVKMDPPWPFHDQWMVNECVEKKATWNLSWKMADGNVKMEHGFWQLTPLPGGKTRLQYHLTVDPWMDAMPSWVIEMVTRSVMPDIVKGVHKRVAALQQ